MTTGPDRQVAYSQARYLPSLSSLCHSLVVSSPSGHATLHLAQETEIKCIFPPPRRIGRGCGLVAGGTKTDFVCYVSEHENVRVNTIVTRERIFGNVVCRAKWGCEWVHGGGGGPSARAETEARPSRDTAPT